MKKELIRLVLRAGLVVRVKGISYHFNGELVIKGKDTYTLEEAVKEISSAMA